MRQQQKKKKLLPSTGAEVRCDRAKTYAGENRNPQHDHRAKCSPVAAELPVRQPIPSTLDQRRRWKEWAAQTQLAAVATYPGRWKHTNQGRKP